jgi:hypothetical protein
MTMSLQLSAQAQENHRRFVERARATGQVWGLRSADGWAVCPSNEDDDANVLVFWSDEAYAKRHARGEWSQYAATAIPLDEFVRTWLPGMEREGMRVGTNWDVNLAGVELAPADLAAQLA